ncbi:ethanolamine ammonia-lyase light chain EutC [Klebsiella variicola subsp. variicola]|nr:ethanolamine ammonia-lyase light chain EutC [Klebsiella variicola subsp. variicola]
MDPDVQVVVSDGLSTDAITANYEEILPPLLAGLETGGSEGRDAVLRALWPRQD